MDSRERIITAIESKSPDGIPHRHALNFISSLATFNGGFIACNEHALDPLWKKILLLF